MKKHISKSLICYIALTAITLITGIILLCLGRWKESIFAFLPFPFCTWTFWSFYYPKDIQKNVPVLVLTIVSRFTCNVISMVVPAVMWRFVPSFHDSVSYYWILMPFIEVMIAYALYAVANITEKKESKK